MAEIRWSLTAGDDLQELENFIARDSALHAINFIDRIVESTGKLERLPELGRVVPEFGRADIRELLFRGFRVVYLLRSDAVFILRVVHGTRDLAEVVRKEPWELSE